MAKKIIYFMIMCCVSFTTISADLELRSDHPQKYVVKKGDTLWDISAVFLKSPWLWPEIWQVNPQINNPHLIYPGDILELAFCDGKPCLKRTSGRLVKLSPGVRATQNDHVIPPIPLDVIKPFLSRPRVVDVDTLELAPYIVASQDEHLIAGDENTVYVRGIKEDDQRARYMIFRSSDVYRNPPAEGEYEGEILGYEALYVGDVEMERFGDPSTALITLSQREVLIGDRLLPEEDPFSAEFQPHAPEHEVNGKIISVVDGVSQIGQYQIVVLNQGASDGLEVGHVLSIHESGRFVRDPIAHEQNQKRKLHIDEVVELPEERIGELMVFRTFERVSYALVMDLQRPAHIYDAVHLP